jgi:uridine kinase
MMDSQQSVLVLGIAGGTGSGKSTLVEHLLKSEVGQEITVLPHDHYYFSREQIPLSLRETENWDHPDTIDNSLYLEHLNQLSRGLAVESPLYCFATHSRRSETKLLQARKIILVEGILVLAIPEICRRLDWRVFIDIASDERVLRRLVRDVQHRGRSLPSVVAQYRGSVRPMHEAFIQPSRQQAHLILPNSSPEHLEKAAELLSGFLRTRL